MDGGGSLLFEGGGLLSIEGGRIEGKALSIEVDGGRMTGGTEGGTLSMEGKRASGVDDEGWPLSAGVYSRRL